MISDQYPLREPVHLILFFLTSHLFTWAVKKAGVRDPEGSAGLFRAIEPISLLESRRGGEQISNPLGFLALGG